MKKYLLAATALAMVSGIGAASAADLPTRKGPPVAPVYVPPAFTWTGFYVGLNAGGVFSNGNRNNFGFGGGGGGNNSGFIGGAQAGYNYQFGLGSGFVLGVEGDIDWASVNNKNNNAFGTPLVPGTVVFAGNGGGSSGNYVGTARLRAGYAFDRFLVYATGGAAFGDIGRRTNNGAFAVTQAGFVNPFTGVLVGAPTTTFLGTGGSSSSNVGWTVGGGVEYAVWQNWSIKAEYLYYNLGNGKNNNTFTPFVFGTNNRRNQDGSVVRVGLNYRFW
jgi:outer membrane immunogenic protein